ncbi:MAG: sodium:solute symporter family protein [Acidobacteriota bacterium]
MKGTPLGLAGLVAVLAYLGLILAVAWRARLVRPSESLSHFYLAGRNLGPFVLFATLYATQYSGNSLLGYPGEAYRIGFAWIMSVGFMMGIVVAYLLVAPRLYLLAKRHAYLTPGDWLDHRYRSPALSWTANTLTVVALANYLFAQLMAMGHIVAGLSGGAVPYWVGVVALTLVIVVYETVGGLHAVAWTDGVQGTLLVVGLGGILLWIVPTPAALHDITAWVMANHPRKPRSLPGRCAPRGSARC